MSISIPNCSSLHQALKPTNGLALPNVTQSLQRTLRLFWMSCGQRCGVKRANSELFGSSRMRLVFYRLRRSEHLTVCTNFSFSLIVSAVNFLSVLTKSSYF